jgi:5-methylcytosine-specific restriction protein A
MEFDLSRIIFSANGTLTWVLNVPCRKQNRLNLENLGYGVQNLDDRTVGVIHRQMTICNERANRTPRGYFLCKDEASETAIERFLDIVRETIEADQQREVSQQTHNTDGDVGALEGQIKESQLLGRRRNRDIVEKRKRRDRFTCQACGFFLRVNGRHVIECHHLSPLRKERTTRLTDLVCLCPTCHRVAHRRDNPYTVKEIKALLKQPPRGVGIVRDRT